jgi:mono/diheme cytochrome c family protein
VSTYHSEKIPFPSPRRLRQELLLRRPPRWLVLSLVTLFVPAGITLAFIFHARHTLSEKPRIHLIQDMDVQPRYGLQAASDVFADGRAMRLPVAGTIARGGLEAATRPASTDANLLARGRTMFNVYCAICHGPVGDGHGAVNDLAVQNKEPKWVPATPLLSADIRQRDDTHLYNTIRNGIRTMPPYGSQIQTRDRWAVVAYVRELQRQHPMPAATQPAAGPTP